MENYFTDKIYDNLTLAKFQKGEYEGCVFKNCDWSSGNLGGYSFIDCEFENCNLSNCIVDSTSFRDVSFISCKLIGIDFSIINKFIFSISLEECNLDYSVFYEM
ncbi:MAG TPA: pentapeptide repeat-containing protein, partial [Bacteroidetes bacterium]|nr:pentapeptide repeat-containing protein [Bacteroidota bacterium]